MFCSSCNLWMTDLRNPSGCLSSDILGRTGKCKYDKAERPHCVFDSLLFVIQFKDEANSSRYYNFAFNYFCIK